MFFVTSATERYLALPILAMRGQSHGRPTGGANLLRQACECWPCVDFAMAQSHGTREFIGGGELVPRPATAAQTRGWRQPFECWQCADFAIAESHGTCEFIGGEELVPRPETAAQTHGWRQPFQTPWLNFTERVNSQAAESSRRSPRRSRRLRHKPMGAV